MDLNVLVVGDMTSVILVLLMYLGKKPGWGILGMIAVCIAGVVAGAVVIDGSVTQTCGASTCALASSNNQVLSDFGIFEVMTSGVAVGNFVITVRKIFRI